MEGTAETLLHSLQRVLLEAAGASDDRATGRQAMRGVERTYGGRATHYGRLLSDLVAGSHAWDLFEAPPAHARSLPRVHELSQCESLLRLMRESGELAERERLLKERDAAQAAAWLDASRSEEERRLAADGAYDDYFHAVERVTEAYRSHYDSLRRAASGAAAPLAGPRVRSRLLLQPPLMALLFSACHADKDGPFLPAPGGARGSLEYRQGRNALQILPAEPDPLRAEVVTRDREVVRAWAGGGTTPALDQLDEMAWDVAALAVSAFYVRTGGSDIDASFPFLVDDYFQWRGVDPRKRTRELRRQVADRIELLCSDRVQVRGETDLWLTDPQTGRRKKTPVLTEGSLLVRRARLARRPAAPEDAEMADADGYLLSLGEWARTFVAERAMLGVFLKRLAEYDLQRQRWERRIGWYLVFQMNNQASKMTFEDVTRDGKTRTLVTPQHPLKMGTVLSHSHVPWEEMARTNPGKVIKQWCDALETLRRDGVIGPYACLDGPVDGGDLPMRGRLTAMLERRYQFVPGKDLLPHVRAKRGGAERRRQR